MVSILYRKRLGSSVSIIFSRHLHEFAILADHHVWDDFYSHVYMLCTSQGLGMINGSRGRSIFYSASQRIFSNGPVARCLPCQRLVQFRVLMYHPIKIQMRRLILSGQNPVSSENPI
jgi:hypothetical protein